MKTISFHSYKGGVGCSLALANFAKALMKAGKRVTVLDMDFEAPGIHMKLGLPLNIVKRGFVDYLVDKSRLSRSRYANDDRLDIRQYAQPLDDQDRSFLIPAGDFTRNLYWGLIASETFNRFFYLDASQLDDPEAGKWLVERNFAWFREDKRLVKETFQPDYLLIDCRTATERASVPLLLFADTVVTLFAPNSEGMYGTALMLAALQRQSHKISAIPVVSRVPESYSEKDAEKLRTGVFTEIWQEVGESFVLPDHFHLLHEYRGLESQERLVLDSQIADDLEVMLTHDYVELFCAIAPEIDDELKNREGNDGKDWKQTLGMNPAAEIFERYFALDATQGRLLNRDSQPNVALRVETLRQMMDTVYGELCAASSQNQQLVLAAFLKAGLAAGTSFGKEIMQSDKLWKAKPPADLKIRLVQWAQFDSDVGFGKISAELQEGSTLQGTVAVAGNFLTGGRQPSEPDINQFLRGYLQGVLRLLLEKDNIEVAIVDNENFEFAEK